MLLLWRVSLVLAALLGRFVQSAAAHVDLDEEDLAHLDSLDDYEDDYDDGYFDPYQADMMGGVDLADLFGDGIDEEMLAALFGDGAGGDIEQLLESLGLHVAEEEDEDARGSVKLVNQEQDEEEEEDYFEQAEL